MKILTFAMKDYLIDLITKYKNPTNTLRTLKDEYESKDPTMVLNFNYKLSTVKFQNFTSIKEPLRMAHKIKNQLAIRGEIVLAKILV